MKKTILCALLFACACCFSQTAESLDARAQELFAATNHKDMAKIMALTYNKIFDGTGIDKAQLADAMQAAFDNEVMQIDIDNPMPAKYEADAIKTIEGKKFSVIRYRNSIKMKLKQTMDPAVINGMIDGMKSAGNYDKVEFDEKTNSFLIGGNAIMIAVADESTHNQWEFVNYDNKEMFNIVFNENIKKQLGL